MIWAAVMKRCYRTWRWHSILLARSNESLFRRDAESPSRTGIARETRALPGVIGDGFGHVVNRGQRSEDRGQRQRSIWRASEGFLPTNHTKRSQALRKTSRQFTLAAP